MKLKTALAVSVLCLIPSVSNSFDIEVKIGQMAYKDSRTDGGNSVKLEIGSGNKESNSLYISLKREAIRRYGYTFNMDYIGGGVKLKTPLKFLRIYGEIGYYWPKPNVNNFSRDLVYQAQRRAWGCAEVGAGCVALESRYTVDISSAVGAEIGVEFNYPLTNRFTANMSVGYRILRTEEYLRGWSSSGELGNMQSVTQNYDAMSMFGGISYEW